MGLLVFLQRFILFSLLDRGIEGVAVVAVESGSFVYIPPETRHLWTSTLELGM